MSTFSSPSLPIAKCKDLIIDSLSVADSVIVIGETGSGKSTQMPQFIVGQLPTANNCKKPARVAITQPKRIAAITLAKRVAAEMNCSLGHEVGYAVRFDERSSPSTIIKYLTDGMLLREYLSDPLLSNYDYICIDEVHERSLRTDILLGLLKHLQHIRKPKQPLKIVIMSATMDAEKFELYLSKYSAKRCPNVNSSSSPNGMSNLSGCSDANGPTGMNGHCGDSDEIMAKSLGQEIVGENVSSCIVKTLVVPGRQHPVSILHTLEPQKDYLEAAVITCFQIHLSCPSSSGDILVFLTGQEDIDMAHKMIHENAKSVENIVVVPIYAALPPHLQLEVFKKAPPGKRKIVLATNIAESSITIPGVKFVIDSGLSKSRVFHPKLGTEKPFCSSHR